MSDKASGTAPVNAGSFRKTRFSIDDDQYEYEGWTKGDLWNGWECPFFEKGEADRMVQGIADRAVKWAYQESLGYDAARDAYVYHCQDDEGEEELFIGEDISTPEGTKRTYAIGAWSWVWSEVREDVTQIGHADGEELPSMKCPYCGGELQQEQQPDGCFAYVPHDHRDDSVESLERPRGDY